MVFKHKDRKQITKTLLTATVTVIFSLFYFHILNLDSLAIYLALCIFSLYLVIVLSLYTETHIHNNETILIKCLYYQKKIQNHDIQHAIVSNSTISMYKKNNQLHYTFSNTNNARFEALVSFIRTNNIKVITK